MTTINLRPKVATLLRPLKKSEMTVPDRVTFTLVSDYSDQHGFQDLAQELRNEVKYCKLDLESLN